MRSVFILRHGEVDAVFLSNAEVGRLKERAKAVTISRPESVVKLALFLKEKAGRFGTEKIRRLG